MFKRVTLLFFILSFSLHVYSACSIPQAFIAEADKTPGMKWLDNHRFKSGSEANQAAQNEAPPVILTEIDLCYKFSSKWGVGGLQKNTPGEFRHIEKGTRMGWCQIELYGDLTYKNFTTTAYNAGETAVVKQNSTIRGELSRTVFDLNPGIDWPMKDCSKVPPECDAGYAALRISNNMHNTTDVGLINGDKTTIVQNWTCIKI